MTVSLTEVVSDPLEATVQETLKDNLTICKTVQAKLTTVEFATINKKSMKNST